jgi:hypothetical protein
MTGLEEKFWDAAITEAATTRRPPDQAHQILLRLQNPELDAPTPKARVFRLRRVLWFAGELALAAAVVLAIGWLTGLLRLPQEVEPGGEKLEVAAAPETRYELVEGKIELQNGWLLVSTGTPAVRRGNSVLEQVDGRVLVHASGVPTREQAEAVLGWLNANGLEMVMVGEIKRWVQGLGMAALVISGSALLDGERIQAQEEQKTEPGQWFTVRTVMDIDKLPTDAKLVRGEGVSGAHLEFLAAHQSIESIDFRDCENLRADHIEALRAMKNLRVLELRGARWDGTPDYFPLSNMLNLRELAVDYLPIAMHFEGQWPPKDLDWEARWSVRDSLRELSDHGVLITLGNLSDITGTQLAGVVQRLTNLQELNLWDNDNINDADMRALAEHQSLRSLNIEDCTRITELGIAYLAKKNRLASLRLNPQMSDAILYQLSLMTNLEQLDVPAGLRFYSEDSAVPIGDATRAAFEALSTLQKLKHLTWGLQDGVTSADFAPLAKLKSLTSLRLDGWSGPAELIAFEIASVVPVTTIEFDADSGLVSDNGWQEDAVTKSRLDKLAQNKTLVEIRMNLYIDTQPTEAGKGGMLPALLAKAPGVKRIRVLSSDPVDVEFLKEYAKLHLASYQVEVVLR